MLYQLHLRSNQHPIYFYNYIVKPIFLTQEHLRSHILQIERSLVTSDHVDHAYLVGGWATPRKKLKVNWDDYSQYMGK